MRTIFILFSLLFTLTVNAASHKELPAKGNLSLQVFDNANVRFLPNTYPSFSEADSDDHDDTGTGYGGSAIYYFEENPDT